MNATTFATQKSLALIRAREVATNLSLPIVVLDPEGTIVFYNAAAEKMLGGRRFEEAGELSGEEWAAAFRPERLDGTPAALECCPRASRFSSTALTTS